jgi:hypothetical protein
VEASTIGHSVSDEAVMREHAHAGMSLYGSTGSRKYLNAAERWRFIKAVRRVPLEVQLFCLVLSLSGGRISEILSLTPAAIDLESHTYEAPSLSVWLVGTVAWPLAVHAQVSAKVIGFLSISSPGPNTPWFGRHRQVHE